MQDTIIAIFCYVTDFSKHAARKESSSQKKKGFLTLSPQEVAAAILKQIDQSKPLQIIDWKYQWLVALSRLLPKTLVQRLLRAQE
jgi:short-subunit dehydrogenase